KFKHLPARFRTILDTVQKHLRALDVLGLPTSHWDTLIIHLVVSKLDDFTRREWEARIGDGELPTYEQLRLFLHQRCRMLESFDSDNCHKNRVRNFSSHKSKSFVCTSNTQCFICKKA
ncbi:unnamed protein product, partial [Callosobruchus maculatus]